MLKTTSDNGPRMKLQAGKAALKLYQDAMHIISEKHFGRITKVVHIGGTKTQTIVSACKKTTARTKPWKVGTTSQVNAPRTTHEKTLPHRQRETLGTLSKLQLEDPTRHQRINILNLAKLTALECIINRCSWRPPAKQEVLLRKHSDHESCLYSSQRDQESCVLSGEVVEQHTHFLAHHMFSVARGIKVGFRFFCDAAMFSVLL